tara:strand:+ start:6272 stop:6907 length:636 start_codon:yes stop_codon:yes gene_type:complete
MAHLEKKIEFLYVQKKLSVKQISDLTNIKVWKVRSLLDSAGVKRRDRSEAIRYLNTTKHKKGSFTIKTKRGRKLEEIRIAGVMLYWGEGTKKGNGVVFSNSDPQMIQVFLQFLRNVCGVSEGRLRALIHLYPEHNKEKVTKFWSKITGIPMSQFSKPYVHKGGRGTYKTSAQYGTLSLRYSDKELLTIINGWIEEYKKTCHPSSVGRATLL